MSAQCQHEALRNCAWSLRCSLTWLACSVGFWAVSWLLPISSAKADDDNPYWYCAISSSGSARPSVIEYRVEAGGLHDLSVERDFKKLNISVIPRIYELTSDNVDGLIASLSGASVLANDQRQLFNETVMIDKVTGILLKSKSLLIDGNSIPVDPVSGTCILKK